MSDKQNETIADIVRDKRRRADDIERDVSIKMASGEMVSDQFARELVADLRKEADCIEAAWKRERHELIYSFDPTKTGRSKAPDPVAYAIEGMKGFEQWKRNKEPSTSQAREEGDSVNPECLKKDNGDIIPQSESVGNAAAMREALVEVRFKLPYFLQYMRLRRTDDDGGYYDRLLATINAALSAPPKNCDRFNSVKDAAIAFARERQDAPQPCPDFTFSAWLFATAAERKGGNNGK